MTGFKPEPIRYRLTFAEDTGLAGLQVTMGSISVGENNRMLRIAMANRGRLQPGEDSTPEELAAIEAARAQAIEDSEWSTNIFCQKLVSWNLLDQAGKKVPATRRGVESQDRALIAVIIDTWQRAMIKLPDPLSNGSGSGETTEEASLDLESASESPSN